MGRRILCYGCGKLLLDAVQGSTVLKEGFHAYCLNCDSKKKKPVDFDSIFSDLKR